MVSRDSLRDILHQPGLSKIDRILLCLAVDVSRPKSVNETKILAINGGLREASRWNISNILKRSKGKAVLVKEGWVLTLEGKAYVKNLTAPFIKPETIKVASSLRQHLAQIKEPNTHKFVEEGIKCFEAGLKRAAVVFSWVGAISVLYEHVLKNELSAFNAEAKRRNPKWKDAKKRDDFTRIKEKDFLDILEAISVLGKSVKQELVICLNFRNGCGHPSSLKIGETRVMAHLETLILNIFSQFKA